MKPNIRKAAVAGLFYPDDKETLSKSISDFLKKVPPYKSGKNLKALIIPHAGYTYSGQVAAYAYKLLKEYKKRKIILLGPSHHSWFSDVACDVNDYWTTPLGNVKIMKNDFPKLKEPHLNEHCLEVQLPFLQMILDDFEVLPLLTGNVEPENISKSIAGVLNDDSVFLISSDLSHFLPYNKAVEVDRNTITAIENLDYDKIDKEGDACGKIPILIAVAIARTLKWECRLLNYQNSGDVTGDKNGVVGYASFGLFA